MKKTFGIILVIVIVILVLFIGWYNENLSEKRVVSNYNSEYEVYIDEDIVSGVDLTTIINKAMDNNETYSIEKDENEHYINDDNYYTEIYIMLEEDGDSYAMEAFYEVGIDEFTSLYGEAEFECTSIEYHENGRISKMNFEIIN